MDGRIRPPFRNGARRFRDAEAHAEAQRRVVPGGCASQCCGIKLALVGSTPEERRRRRLVWPSRLASLPNVAPGAPRRRDRTRSYRRWRGGRTTCATRGGVDLAQRWRAPTHVAEWAGHSVAVLL